MNENYNTMKELGFWLWLRWHLASKKQKARMTISRRDIAPGEFVTVKCKVCGRKTCFCPSTVMLPPECECGNSDSGNCTFWKKGQFGKFELVQIYTLRWPTYEDIRKRFTK